MDSGRFVRLLSVLAAPASRRAVTRGLASVMAGSVLAPLIGHASVEAKKKKGHKKKQKGKAGYRCYEGESTWGRTNSAIRPPSSCKDQDRPTH
jgi:hypothetical protein